MYAQFRPADEDLSCFEICRILAVYNEFGDTPLKRQRCSACALGAFNPGKPKNWYAQSLRVSKTSRYYLP
jgi:hypothetical protein